MGTWFKVCLAVAIVIFLNPGLPWAAGPVAISPGAPDSLPLLGQNCPTFSWSAIAAADAYRLEVYTQAATETMSREVMQGIAAPVLRKDIPAPALSWTPASEECLPRGFTYVWFVQGADAGGRRGDWSAGSSFQVGTAVLNAEQQDAVKEIVREYLGIEGAGTVPSGGISSTAINRNAVAISPQALTTLTAYGDAANMNTVLGNGAGSSLSTGTGNTFVGTSAGNISDGSFNTFLGSLAGSVNTSGNSNLFAGASAGYTNAGGSNNVFLGPAAGNQNTSGNFNSFAGYQAGFSNTSGTGNTAVGYQAGYSNQTGGNNSAVGYRAGYNNTTYTNNFFGYDAGYSNTWGYSNNFIGYRAGYSNVGGNNNSFVGYEAGYFNTAGIGNSFFGNFAGYNSTGSRNVFLGWSAGRGELGDQKLYIDNCFTGETPPSSGNFCVHPLIYGEFDNRMVRIDGSLTMVTIATPSDVRYKKDVHPLEASLDKVLHLQGVTYEWDKDKVKGAGYKSGRQIGLIAQEVEKVLPALVHTDSEGYKTLSYDKVVPVLVEAMKEQQAVIEGQKLDAIEKNARIERLEKALEITGQRLAVLENQTKTAAQK